MWSDEEMSEMVNSLVMKGYLEIDGVDSSTGEFLYKVNPELYEVIPDLHDKLQKAFLDEVYNLWIKGMLSMDATLENPLISLTENAFNEDLVAELEPEERHTLFIIMQAMRKED